MDRFGSDSLDVIDKNIKKSVPNNTVKSKNSVWSQFSVFLQARNYALDADTTTEKIAEILKDWAHNMKKANGEHYKEKVVKTMWNQTAKLVQEKYYNEFHRKIDPFKSLIFQSARDAKNAKRRQLQADPSKHVTSASAVEKKNIDAMLQIFDEETPDGLQRKLFVVMSVELAWRGGEGAAATVHHFREERSSDGELTGRVEYNPIFIKTTQDGDRRLATSKWLVQNKENPQKCPVRLLRTLLSKRSENLKTERLFRTANPAWQNPGNVGWYEDSLVGPNTKGTWFNNAATRAGLNTSNKKITNHSSRTTAVSILAKSGVSEQEIIKMTGHSNPNSIKPYLQLDAEHHGQILTKMHTDAPSTSYQQTPLPVSSNLMSQTSNQPAPLPAPSNLMSQNTASVSSAKATTFIYNNCTFNCSNLNMNK